MAPLIAIPACNRCLNGHRMHATPGRYADAILAAECGVPILAPPVGPTMLALLDRIDGLLLSGSPSNVAPAAYGVTEDRTPDRHDPPRDQTTLPLIQVALARGLPVLAICRGIQELNVARGGTLHQLVATVPGRFGHDAPDDLAIEEQYQPSHPVTLTGELGPMLGATRIAVNSLHEQAIDRLGRGLVAEAFADDGTIEAVRVADAAGFAFGVQWHPEWMVRDFPDRLALFTAFGAACRAYAARQGRG